MSKNDYLTKAYQQREQLTDTLIGYWTRFNWFDSWQFWLALAMLIIPLVVLYIKIDRSRLFVLGFFGFCVHMVTTFVDITGVNLGYWQYPYYLVPFLPVTLGLDSSLIPVVFILLYQWTTRSNKNYYLYALILGAGFAFLIKPLMNYLDLFRLHKGLNFLELYVFAYVPIILLSKWIFNTFVFLEKRQVEATNEEEVATKKFRFFLNFRRAKNKS